MKFKNFFLIAAMLLLSHFAGVVTSCSFKLAPAYDAGVKDKVTSASVETSMLYNKIMGASDKNFTTYASDYAQIESEIHEIIVVDNTRKRAKLLTGMATDVLNAFVKYENEHKAAGTLNNTQLRSYKDYMHGIWQPLVNAESNLK